MNERLSSRDKCQMECSNGEHGMCAAVREEARFVPPRQTPHGAASIEPLHSIEASFKEGSRGRAHNLCTASSETSCACGAVAQALNPLALAILYSGNAMLPGRY